MGGALGSYTYAGAVGIFVKSFSLNLLSIFAIGIVSSILTATASGI